MRIMIVDDSKAMRLMVIRALRQAGYGDHEFEQACSGAEALTAIRSSPPDFVLSDWNMPEMNGLDLLKSMSSEGIGVKLGFITSEGTNEMREMASEAGALFLVSKPFTADTLREHLQPHFG